VFQANLSNMRVLQKIWQHFIL